MGTCGHLTSARDTTAIVCTVRSFTYTRQVLLIYLLYSLFARVYAAAVPSPNIDIVPPKSTTFFNTATPTNQRPERRHMREELCTLPPNQWYR